MKSNPFATRHVAPGRVPWVALAADDSIEGISERFRRKLHLRGAIVGPHGSGKSTLLAHLIPQLGPVISRITADGTDANEEQWVSASSTAESTHGDPRPVIWLQLRRRQQPLRTIRASRAYWQTNRVLIVDGYEQIPRWYRPFLIANTWRCSMGLLVTSHRPTWLPTLYETSASLERANRVVSALLKDSESEVKSSLWADQIGLDRILEKHDGNMRELLMELYDCYEEYQQACSQEC